MNSIKQRRLEELTLSSHPELYVGDCVPFYFCSRSIMLYVIYRRNHPELSYRGGQNPIIHLEVDLHQTIDWAEKYNLRWAFTLSNAGSKYFEDRCDRAHLNEIDWNAVQARNWYQCQEGKQAEFLLEQRFAWKLVSRIGVQSQQTYSKTIAALADADHRPIVEIRPDWYY